MAKAKKGSPEAKAWAEKMKAAREAAKEANKEVKATPEPTPSEPEDVESSNEDVSALLKRIEELEQRQFFSPQVQQAVKAITKYSINPKDWFDPTPRLADEPRLQEHAFKQNYVLKWEVGRVNYQKDGVNYTEPKFKLELWRWVRDSETNELTQKQFRRKKGTFFEDPDAAIQMAIDRGHEIDDTLQKPFLDEMRYLRMRDWLFEIFYPIPAKPQDGVREEVIGNTLVPVMEISSVDPQNIPFDKL